MRLVGPAKKKSTLFPLLCVLLLLSFARRVEQWEAEQWKREKPEASVDSHLDKCICCSCRRQPTLEWQWQHHLFALMQSTIIKNLHSWVYRSLIVESLAIAVVTHHHQDLQQPLHTCYSCYLLPSSFILNQGDLKLSDQTQFHNNLLNLLRHFRIFLDLLLTLINALNILDPFEFFGQFRTYLNLYG